MKFSFSSSLSKIPVARIPLEQLPYPHLKHVSSYRKRALAQHRVNRFGEAPLRIAEGGDDFLAWRTLQWDSSFFKKRILMLAAHRFSNRTVSARLIQREDRFLVGSADYVFAQIPAEDSVAMDILCQAGWSPIEWRVTYAYPDLAVFRPPRRFSVREAGVRDVAALGQVASTLAKNPLDRFHCDPFFSPRRVERFMKVWVKNSVRHEFADAVLIPRSGPSAFMALRFLKKEWPVLGFRIGQISLSAVRPSVSGWHPKLLSESLLRLKQEGADSAIMTTQAGNRAVIRSCEWVGMKYACASVILRRILNPRSPR